MTPWQQLIKRFVAMARFQWHEHLRRKAIGDVEMSAYYEGRSSGYMQAARAVKELQEDTQAQSE